jgi:4-hydroxybenzoate polyprenyltransferase
MERILRSQLIVSLCALAFAAETYLVTGLPVNPTGLALIFTSTLLLYSIAQLRLDLSRAILGKIRLSLTGRRMNMVLAGMSLLVTLPLLTQTDPSGQLVYLLISLSAILYVMPFNIRGRNLRGLREIPVFKNILLSAVWSFATVMLPFAFTGELLFNEQILFMAMRRFLFVYSLTVIFDIRDQEHDRRSGFWTLPMGVGVKNTKMLAFGALVLFLIFTITDPTTVSSAAPHYREALIFSALVTMALIMLADIRRKNSYYIVIVDGAMIMQFLIVVTFSLF